ncbi:MAG: hypothetical protein IKN57_09645 [Parasporobacterium sp.]|nr:hypothetical protein [Parasporobacterium sp.]
MTAIGVMPMPAGFRYREVFLKGKPRHDRFDAFRARHPEMSRGKRAKIFAPFDALKGFDEAVSAKTVLYQMKKPLGREDSAELSRRLNILHEKTYNSRLARANNVAVSVTWYEPCSDINHEDYGFRGQYRTIKGICRNVDVEITQTVQVDKIRIPIDDILNIEADGDLFLKRETETSADWGA